MTMAVAAVDIGTGGMNGFDLLPCPRFSYPEHFDRTKFDAWLRLSGITAGRSVEDVLVDIEVAERTVTFRPNPEVRPDAGDVLELVPRATDQAKVGAT